jgi:hypothetical protein
MGNPPLPSPPGRELPRVVPGFDHKNPTRQEIHLQDAESLDATIDNGSNHPKMEGFFPRLHLNALRPRADADTVAAGFKKHLSVVQFS